MDTQKTPRLIFYSFIPYLNTTNRNGEKYKMDGEYRRP